MPNLTENRVYAGFFVRLTAFAIDSLIAAMAAGIVKLPFSIAAMAGADFLNANFIFQYSFLDVLGYVGVAAYFVLLTYFAHSTPGKMLMRLEVVSKSGEWTFLNILYRETIGRFLSSLLCIGYLAVLVQDKKQGFHDMLCDTYVVYKGMQKMGKPVAMAENVASTGNADAENSMPAEAVVKEQSEIVTDAKIQENSVKEEMVPPSAFEMSESHPVSVESKEPSKSYDNMNPDCTNLGIQRKEDERIS